MFMVPTPECAIPPHLRDAATVYLLDPAKGYVAARKGSSGVSCIVVRTDWQFRKEPFHDDIFWPVCYGFSCVMVCVY